MEMLQCSNCNKLTGFKRHLGLGTIIGILLTCGLWVLAIPFYPKRCIVCGSEQGTRSPEERAQRAMQAKILLACLGGLLVCGLIMRFLASDKTTDAPKMVAAQPNAQAPDNWEVISKTNPVTGEITTAASLKGHDEQDIIVRRIGKKLDLYIKTGEFLETPEDDEDGQSTVQYRFDDGKVTRQEWSLSSDNVALFFPGNPAPFLEQIRKAKQLSFEFQPADKIPQTITFDVGGFPNEFK